MFVPFGKPECFGSGQLALLDMRGEFATSLPMADTFC
jgi:hypothetical protein